MTRFGSIVVLLALSAAASAQPRRDAIVIFKDGFDIKGKVEETVRDYIWDKDSGRSFPVFSGNFFLDDHVRKIQFSPHQVTKVYQPKDGEVKQPVEIKRYEVYRQDLSLLKEFQLDKIDPWGDDGKRKVFILNTANKRTIPMTQKVALLTPHHIMVITDTYQWNQMYFTDEFGPELTRKFLWQIFSERKQLKELSEGQKLVEIANFMQQAGWYKDTERELKRIIEDCPSEKKTAEEMLEKLNQEKANLFVENIERAANVGQHGVALERLAVYDRADYQKIVRPALAISASDLKAKYVKAKTDIEQVKKYLQEMPALTKKNEPAWTKATAFIADELNPDTIDRLETFLLFAQQYEADKKAKKQPNQSAEEVLALAVTGWLQGKQAAEPDVKMALKLAAGREFLIEYLTTENALKRASLLSAFTRANDLPIDVMGRLAKMIPPVAPHDAKLLTPKMQTLKIETGFGAGGTYHVQLPPDYHHQRAYPVLILLHSGRDTADETLERFSEEAAKYGFILVAPQWTGKGGLFKGNKVQPGAKQQQLVLDTLTDLRRRFQIDSDRVFLWGWEDGGGLAFDVGLGHPDLFAGVAPMNGVFTPYAKRFYWPNAQYLPFYIIDGERNGGNAKIMRDVMKDWTKVPYNCIYVEYKGRGSEWFGLEIPKVLNWMSRKKRYSPLKEIGRRNFSSKPEEEFHSTRGSDNRFYWLSCESIADRYLLDTAEQRLPFPTYVPATFQANISMANKSKKDGTSDIWTMADLRVTGAKKISFWITPGMIDWSKPLLIRLNGQEVGRPRNLTPSMETMLEELYRTGDRQRLFVAKIDL